MGEGEEAGGSPLFRSVEGEGPLDEGGQLKTANDDAVWLGNLFFYQLTSWSAHKDQCTVLHGCLFYCVRFEMKVSVHVSLCTEKLFNGSVRPESFGFSL